MPHVGVQVRTKACALDKEGLVRSHVVRLRTYVPLDEVEPCPVRTPRADLDAALRRTTPTCLFYNSICALTDVGGIWTAKSNASTLCLKVNLSVISGLTSNLPLAIRAMARG